jgi:tripartite-type tricarboxylate transporter receptor subunit TctC
MEDNVMTEKALWNAKGGTTVQERKPAGRGQAMQRALMTAGAIVVAVLLIVAKVAPLCAQSYPNKPIRFILPMATGGTQDILGRIIGQKLAERLGQPVLPENRGGSGGNIGYEFAAKARPDGYTIVLGGTSLSISPSLYKKLNYDPIKDFAPISRVSQMPYLLIVRPSLPVKNLKELVAYAKANPGKLNYGSSGLGASAQLASELFTTLATINVMHVPYKGAAQMLIGLMGGEVDMLVIGPPAALSQIQAGKVRALAVMSEQRVPLLPNVPTIKEAGIDNCEVTAWYGILAPAGTPRDIVNRLNAEWIKIAAMPDTKELMQNAGFEPLSGTPEQFADFIKIETVRWAKVIKDANIMSIE